MSNYVYNIIKGPRVVLRGPTSSKWHEPLFHLQYHPFQPTLEAGFSSIHIVIVRRAILHISLWKNHQSSTVLMPDSTSLMTESQVIICKYRFLWSPYGTCSHPINPWGSIPQTPRQTAVLAKNPSVFHRPLLQE